MHDRELAPVDAGDPSSGEIVTPNQELPRRLAGTPPARQEMVIEAYVREAVATVLGLPSGQVVPPTRGLWELGLTSRQSLDLHQRLEAGVGRRLMPSLVFNYPNVRALARYLIDLLAGSPRQTRSAETATVPPPVTTSPSETGEPVSGVQGADQSVECLRDELNQLLSAIEAKSEAPS